MTNNHRLEKDKRSAREVKRDREARKIATTQLQVDENQVDSIGSSVGETVQNSELNSEFNCHCNEECPDSDDELQNVKEDVLSTISSFEDTINAVRNNMYDAVDNERHMQGFMETMKKEEEHMRKTGEGERGSSVVRIFLPSSFFLFIYFLHHPSSPFFHSTDTLYVPIHARAIQTSC